MPSSRPCNIRQLVQQRFFDLASTENEIQGETVLIRDGKYCGHRYHSVGLTAVWFLEEEEVKIYDVDGHVLSVEYPSEAQNEPPTDQASAA